MKKRHAIALVILLIAVNSFGQSKQNLSKQLWERAQSCYSNFEDTNNKTVDKPTIIDDSKNGYLKVSGTIGTCGCTCSKTIAAFKGKNKKYTFLEQEVSDCSWLHKVSSNKDLTAIFPKGFGIHTFIPTLKDIPIKEALFYLDVAIPQYGTETKVTLKLIPFGMHIKSDSLLIYNFSEYDKRASPKFNPDIKQALLTLSDKGIDLIINKCEKLSKKDNVSLGNYLQHDENNTIEELRNELIKLRKIYDTYNKMEQQSILLKWDKNKARFIIKEKGNPVKPISFYQFLRNHFIKYWEAIC